MVCRRHQGENEVGCIYLWAQTGFAHKSLPLCVAVFDGCNARNAFYSKVINADNAESRLLKGSQNTPPHARAVLRRRSSSIPNGYELIGALSDIRNGQLVYHVAHGYGVVAGMTDTGFCASVTQTAKRFINRNILYLRLCYTAKKQSRKEEAL